MTETALKSPPSSDAGRQVPFSEALERPEDAPETFHKAFAKVGGGEAQKFVALIHTPSFVSFREKEPETVLGLTETRWVLLAKEEEGAVTTTLGDLADVRVVELSQVLLEGVLRLVVAEGAEVVISFNMVSADLFRAAVRVLLAHLAPVSADQTSRPTSPTAIAGIEALPFKLRSALFESIPPDDVPRALASWEAMNKAPVFPWSKTVTNPGGALVVTDRTVFVTLDASAPTSDNASGFASYGRHVTYLNRRFPLRWSMTPQEKGQTLALTIGTTHAVSRYFQVPSEAAAALQEVLGTLH